MGWLDDKAIGYAISADMSRQLAQCIAALPEDHGKADQQESDAIRQWAEVNYLPSDGIWRQDAVSPRRYLAIRIRPRQGALLRDGNRVRHFCIVTNRSDPEGGSGLDLIRCTGRRPAPSSMPTTCCSMNSPWAFSPRACPVGPPCPARNSAPTSPGCAST
jgi:hypothetical protein